MAIGLGHLKIDKDIIQYLILVLNDMELKITKLIVELQTLQVLLSGTMLIMLTHTVLRDRYVTKQKATTTF
jgi:hypothetical protein